MTPKEIAALANNLYMAFYKYFDSELAFELTKIALRNKLETDFSFMPPPVD